MKEIDDDYQLAGLGLLAEVWLVMPDKLKNNEGIMGLVMDGFRRRV